MYGGFYIVLGIVVWVIVAFWPARVAARKGYSFLGFFILSIFFFPLSLILAYVVKDKLNSGVSSDTEVE